MRWFKSISSRLFWTSSVLIVLFLLAVGLFLDAEYRSFSVRDTRRQLGMLFSALLAAADTEGLDFSSEQPQLTNYAPELFSRVYSGWYWQIRRLNSDETADTSQVLISNSLWTFRFGHVSPGNALDGETVFFNQAGPFDQKLLMLQRTVQSADGALLEISVAIDTRRVDQAMSKHTRILFVTLGLLGIALVVGIVVQVGFGLRPLNRLRRDLLKIRTGKISMLATDYPPELQPLADQLNETLDDNQQIVERAKTHVGNLAHAIKTPLSVIQNVLTNQFNEDARIIRGQTAIMNTHVQHHLQRARAAARAGYSMTAVPCRPVVDSVLNALIRANHDQEVEVSIVELAKSVEFCGEKTDLEEMLGNLLENAFKWTHSRVSVAIDRVEIGDRRIVELQVEDDGPGLTEDTRLQMLERGRRLDESKPGFGLGLSIVRDLALSYHGELMLKGAEIGGVRAVLHLPST